MDCWPCLLLLIMAKLIGGIFECTTFTLPPLTLTFNNTSAFSTTQLNHICTDIRANHNYPHKMCVKKENTITGHFSHILTSNEPISNAATTQINIFLVFKKYNKKDLLVSRVRTYVRQRHTKKKEDQQQGGKLKNITIRSLSFMYKMIMIALFYSA